MPLKNLIMLGRRFLRGTVVLHSTAELVIFADAGAG